MHLMKRLDQIYKGLSAKTTFTDTEKELAGFIYHHAEMISSMTTRSLGQAAYTSPASITRFCQKLGYKGFPEFKMELMNDLKLTDTDILEHGYQMSKADTIVSIVNNVAKIEQQSIEDTRQQISFLQMRKIADYLVAADYIDFYAYDANQQIAQYGCSQLFHCGKIAYTYPSTNMQQLSSMIRRDGHLAILISRTGENLRLIEAASSLKKSGIRTVSITRSKECTLARSTDQVLVANSIDNIEQLGTVIFSTSAKYILDVLFCIAFTQHYETLVKLNRDYEKIGRNSLWQLLEN